MKPAPSAIATHFHPFRPVPRHTRAVPHWSNA